MMEFLRTDLVETMVISVSHRPGLEEYFDREIHLVRKDGGHATTRDRRYPPLHHLWHRLMRSGSSTA